MQETQTWITAAYYEIARAAQVHPNATIAAGFEGGKEEYYEVSLDSEQPTSDHALVLRVLEILDEEMRPHGHPRLHPSPCFLIGYLAGYVQDYLEATASTERHDVVCSSCLPGPWVTTAYRDIALATPCDSETIEGAFEEGQNLFHTSLFDGSLPKTEYEMALEMLKLFDEPMRADLSLHLPASPNWAVGFLAGYIQAYVQEQQPKTQPLPQLVEEEA